MLGTGYISQHRCKFCCRDCVSSHTGELHPLNIYINILGFGSKDGQKDKCHKIDIHQNLIRQRMKHTHILITRHTFSVICKSKDVLHKLQSSCISQVDFISCILGTIGIIENAHVYFSILNMKETNKQNEVRIRISGFKAAFQCFKELTESHLGETQ